jgi:hypothetical protein
MFIPNSTKGLKQRAMVLLCIQKFFKTFRGVGVKAVSIT